MDTGFVQPNRTWSNLKTIQYCTSYHTKVQQDFFQVSLLVLCNQNFFFMQNIQCTLVFTTHSPVCYGIAWMLLKRNMIDKHLLPLKITGSKKVINNIII